MFGIGMPELIVVLAVALIVLGPKRLPEIARTLGRAMQEFKKATNELKSAVNLDDDFKDIKHTFNDVKGDVWNAAEFHIDQALPEKGKQENGEKADESVPDSGQTVDPTPDQPIDQTPEKTGGPIPDGETKDE